MILFTVPFQLEKTTKNTILKVAIINSTNVLMKIVFKEYFFLSIFAAPRIIHIIIIVIHNKDKGELKVM